jgi:hypothetical protein
LVPSRDHRFCWWPVRHAADELSRPWRPSRGATRKAFLCAPVCRIRTFHSLSCLGVVCFADGTCSRFLSFLFRLLPSSRGFPKLIDNNPHKYHFRQDSNYAHMASVRGRWVRWHRQSSRGLVASRHVTIRDQGSWNMRRARATTSCTTAAQPGIRSGKPVTAQLHPETSAMGSRIGSGGPQPRHLPSIASLDVSQACMVFLISSAVLVSRGIVRPSPRSKIIGPLC